MAAHGFSSGEYNSPRLGQRKCEEWGRHSGNDIRVVWVRLVDYCDDRVVGYDIEYQVNR